MTQLIQPRLLLLHIIALLDHSGAKRATRQTGAGGPGHRLSCVIVDRPGDLGGSDPWEDAESCQHSGSTPRSCASAR
jgi:hypothetical protein